MARKPRRKATPPAKERRGGRRAGSGRKRKRWIEDYAACGAPPSDPLERQVWLSSVLSVALHKTIQDQEIDEATRTQRIRMLARDLKNQVPDERRWLAEKRILEFTQRMDAPPAPTGGDGGDLSDAAAGDPAPVSADYRELRGRGGSVPGSAPRGPAGSDDPKPG